MIYLFHSFDFLRFFIILFLVFWTVPKHYKNIALLIGSYAFFASWDYRFLSMIFISTAVDYFCARAMEGKAKEQRRPYLWTSIIINLSILGFFKYYNFFIENANAALGALGLNPSLATLNIILPLGISFYTFQTMGYTIDVYRGKIKPVRSVVDLALFVAFFPQLIAGPIERVKTLMPQIQRKKSLKEIPWRRVLYLFGFGFFRKVVIADACGRIVAELLAHPDPSGAQTVIAVYAFALQVYADFSGYTFMARGIALCFGITLSPNFNLPFLAKDPAEFFKRWHITLSAWIREYVYMPLFFSLPSRWPIRRLHSKQRYLTAGIIASFVTMVVFGFWHGAAWNFIFLGIYLFAAVMLFKLIRWLPTVLKRVLTFHVVWFGLFFLFRQENLAKFPELFAALPSLRLQELIQGTYWHLYTLFGLLVMYEIIIYLKKDPFWIPRSGFYTQMVFYIILVLLAVNIGAIYDVRFVYFQF
ncbi:MAG: MBOAT family O-acyltransferase [Nanoarchaeota archaeon]